MDDNGTWTDDGMAPTGFDPSTYGASSALYQSYPNGPNIDPATGQNYQSAANPFTPAPTGGMAATPGTNQRPSMVIWVVIAFAAWYLLKKA